MSKVALYYHIVFCTKGRELSIPLQYKEDLYRYIWKVLKDASTNLIRIGGIQNHIHMLINISPTVSLSKLMQSVKSLSSGWMSTDLRYKNFKGWARGYFACSVSPDRVDDVRRYIINQEMHHLGHNFSDELNELYRHAGIEPDDRDMI
ncbi:MAG: IS200/IS605 family transposase [Duncaniella sp.]|nr:IS200/IS605 family transposase [Duncaniella sp.]